MSNDETANRRKFLKNAVVAGLGVAVVLNALDDIGDSQEDDRQTREINRLKEQVEKLQNGK